jgi:hypothetical protein
MYPNTGEWAELGVLFLMGPLHVVACVVFAAIAWWRAPGWSLTLRTSVLAANVVLALIPVAVGLSTGRENEWFHQYGLALAGCELVAVLGLGAVLIGRRSAVVAAQR